MKILTPRDKILNVAEEWKMQYLKADGSWPVTLSGSSELTYKKLLALNPETATKEEVDNIIGKTDWTSYFCDECDKPSGYVVQLGKFIVSIDQAERQMIICKDCLLKAAGAVFLQGGTQ